MLCAPPQPGIRASSRRKAGSESLTRRAFSFPIYLPGGRQTAPCRDGAVFAHCAQVVEGCFSVSLCEIVGVQPTKKNSLGTHRVPGVMTPTVCACLLHGAHGSPWSFSNIKQRVHIHAEHGGDGAQLIIGDLPPTRTEMHREPTVRGAHKEKREPRLSFLMQLFSLCRWQPRKNRGLHLHSTPPAFPRCLRRGG